MVSHEEVISSGADHGEKETEEIASVGPEGSSCKLALDMFSFLRRSCEVCCRVRSSGDGDGASC